MLVLACDREHLAIVARPRGEGETGGQTALGEPVRYGHPGQATDVCEAFDRRAAEPAEVLDERPRNRARDRVPRRGNDGVEPASAASLAGLRKLREAGEVGADEDVVCLTTGHLLKDPDAAYEAGSDPEPVPADTDAVLDHLADE